MTAAGYAEVGRFLQGKCETDPRTDSRNPEWFRLPNAEVGQGVRRGRGRGPGRAAPAKSKGRAKAKAPCRPLPGRNQADIPAPEVVLLDDDSNDADESDDHMDINGRDLEPLVPVVLQACVLPCKSVTRQPRTQARKV